MNLSARPVFTKPAIHANDKRNSAHCPPWIPAQVGRKGTSKAEPGSLREVASSKKNRAREMAFVEAVDAFMPLPKRLVGADAPTWQSGRSADELRLKLPIQIGGELRGQHLVIKAFPNYHNLMFQMGISFDEKVVCRIDFELDGSHGNNLNPGVLPSLIKGPHWHSWELNRDLVWSVLHHDKLQRATPFTETHKFDATLRWYCAKRNIALGHHGIEFPIRERLL